MTACPRCINGRLVRDLEDGAACISCGYRPVRVATAEEARTAGTHRGSGHLRAQGVKIG